jgi:hypothetical protein
MAGNTGDLEKGCAMSGNFCNDCRVDTTPHIGKWEFYMVTDDVWKAAGMPASTLVAGSEFDGNFLCIGCLELRIGRRLTALDFAACPLNNPKYQCKAPRLLNRLNYQLPQSRKDYYADVQKHYGKPWLALLPRECL